MIKNTVNLVGLIISVTAVVTAVFVSVMWSKAKLYYYDGGVKNGS